MAVLSMPRTRDLARRMATACVGDWHASCCGGWFVSAGSKPGTFSDRIVALDGVDTRRFSRLQGVALGDSFDDELPSGVAEAARSLGVPIALVSLVLGRTQYFRAHQGLPPDLAIARATDRDVSFCQFVVRDGAEFVVTDAPNDDRIPQDLVKRFGIRSYVGVPLRIDGVVVGSLCGLDVRPRQFHEEDRRLLAALGEQVSARLGTLVVSSEIVGRALIMRLEAGPPAWTENTAEELRAVLATETSIEVRHDGTAMVLELLFVHEAPAGEEITPP